MAMGGGSGSDSVAIVTVSSLTSLSSLMLLLAVFQILFASEIVQVLYLRMLVYVFIKFGMLF
jgi:hypothetical protein